MTMRLRNEVQLSVGVMVLFNVGLAFFAIALFSRMAPAIDRIVEENATSIANTGVMLAALAKPEGPRTEHILRKAFSNIEQNVTEPDEHILIEQIGAALPHRANPEQRAELVSAIRQLAAVNEQAMSGAGVEATRLGTAGAWVTVWVGLLSALFSLWVLGRLRQRLIAPIEELSATLRAFQHGNGMRRCHISDGSAQLESILLDVNSLLDRAVQPHHSPATDRLGRLALAQVIERVQQPLAVVEHGGRLVSVNQQMLTALAGPEGEMLRAALVQSDVTPPEGLERQPIPDAPGLLCVLTPQIAEQADPIEP